MLTTKEIIDKAIEHSEGQWRPSPQHTYPMLGKLLAEGLINEVENGRFSVTKKGTDMMADIDSARNILQKHIDIVSRISYVGKFVTDRLSITRPIVSSILNNLLKRAQ